MLEEKDIDHNYRLLLGYFLYSSFSGALRKWVFASSSAVEGALLLGQMVAPFLLTYFMRREKGALNYFPILPLVLVFGALALNPLGHSVFHGIFGFVLHLGFLLMIFIYVQERDSFPIERLLPAMIAVSLIESLLGILQFGLPPDHFLNRYVSDNNDVAGFGGDFGARIVGTFSYISGYAAFLIFYGMFIWAMMVENRRSFGVIAGLMGLGLMSSFMNGSRSIVALYLVSVLFGFLGYATFGKKLKAVAVVVVVAVLAIVFNVGEKMDFLEKSLDAFYGRVQFGQESGEAADRTEMTFKKVLEYNGVHPVFGIGLGATYNGAIARWGGSHLLPAYYEPEPERILIEGGYFLLLLRLLLLVLLIVRLKVPVYYSVPVLSFIFMFVPIVFNMVQAAYAFFGIMLLDKMYYLKEKRDLAQ